MTIVNWEPIVAVRMNFNRDGTTIVADPPDGRIAHSLEEAEELGLIRLVREDERKSESVGPPRMDYSRDELVAICERAVVAVDKWQNRDSASAQDGVGRAWVLLKAGCDFTIRPVQPAGTKSGCFTDASTIWIDIDWPGFQAFEYGRTDRHYWEDDTFYLPTPERLDRSNGEDWY